MVQYLSMKYKKLQGYGKYAEKYDYGRRKVSRSRKLHPAMEQGLVRMSMPDKP